MTLREKIGQLIFTGFPSTVPGVDFVDLVKKMKIGNVILFSRNMESTSQVRKLCIELQELIQGEISAAGRGFAGLKPERRAVGPGLSQGGEKRG